MNYLFDFKNTSQVSLFNIVVSTSSIRDIDEKFIFWLLKSIVNMNVCIMCRT